MIESKDRVLRRLTQALRLYGRYRQIQVERARWYRDQLTRDGTAIPDLSRPWDASVPWGVPEGARFLPVVARLTAEEIQDVVRFRFPR